MNEQEMEQYFEAFLEACPDDITITDLNGCIIRASQLANRMFGYDQAGQITGRHVTDFVAPSDRQRAKDNFARRIQGLITSPEEYKAVRADGSVFNIEVNAGFIKDKAGIPYQIVFIIRDITDRKFQEFILVESESKFRNLMEDVKAVSVQGYAPDGTTLYWNKASEKIYGYSAEEAIGRNLLDLIIPPELQEKVKQGIAYMAATGQPIPSSELLLMRKDGSRISVFSSHTIIQIPGKMQELFCIDIDLTELHQVSESLRESEDRFRAISEYSNSAICMVDENARITWGNEALVKLGGYTAEELYTSESFIEYLAPESVDFVMNNFMLFLAGKEYAHNYTFYLKQKSGDLRLCEKYMTDFTDKAGKRFLAISMLDITDRHNAQQELIKAKEKAEESDRLKSAFLANMSHEIRTPMNGILGFTELLKRPDISGEKQQDYIQIIRQSGERLINIINDIIDISKIESGIVTVDLSDFYPDELLDYMYNFFKPETDQKGLRFTCRKPDQSGRIFIRTDHEKLSAILTNLLKNAIKFTKNGFIEFGYHLNGQVLEFYVKDSGTGIAKENIELIFERFRQGSDSLSREYEGAGLGLSIAKAYAELLGGSIRVDSEYQQGCVFHFTIPYGPVKDIAEHIPEPVAAPVVSQESLVKKQDLTILIVEDDEASGLYLSLTLKSLYSKVLLVETGLEAVNLCKSDPSVRVILMDLKMPGMSGFEATKRIREFNKDVLIIAQTAFAFKTDRELAIQAGCNDYITKPVKPNDLIHVISSALQARGSFHD